MHKISVIVPAYNVEDYLENCLESISNQTHSNIEIIVVNDGSRIEVGKLQKNIKRKICD
ncbi:glycosyltransferase family 2 protein [Enterococcus faecium]|nr:glycosyltransferase family 2 protein [Enterococcus faecium]